jgi:hypothetical protein
MLRFLIRTVDFFSPKCPDQVWAHPASYLVDVNVVGA